MGGPLSPEDAKNFRQTVALILVLLVEASLAVAGFVHWMIWVSTK